MTDTARIPQILVAGIGNTWLHDDGFGSEVLRAAGGRPPPPPPRRPPASTSPTSARVVWTSPTR